MAERPEMEVAIEDGGSPSSTTEFENSKAVTLIVPETAVMESVTPTAKSASETSESFHSVDATKEELIKDEPSSPAQTQMTPVQSPVALPPPLPIVRNFGSQRSLTSSTTASEQSLEHHTPPRSQPAIPAPSPPDSKRDSSGSMESVAGLDEIPLDLPASPIKTVPTFASATPKASIFSTFGVTLRKASAGNGTPGSGPSSASPSAASPSSYRAPSVPAPAAPRRLSSSSSITNSSPRPVIPPNRTPSTSSWKASFAGILPTALGGTAAPPDDSGSAGNDAFNSYPSSITPSSSRPVGISRYASSSSSAKGKAQDRCLADTSSSFILNNLQSTSAIRHRADSIGGEAAIRNSFERVRDRSATGSGTGSGSGGGKRDSERLRHAEEFDVGNEFGQDGRSSLDDGLGGPSGGQERQSDGLGSVGRDGVDWQFWGAVVGDYEEIARTRPKELSKAIQKGIPDVIRGTIWQLMSSSKSTSLEQTYSTLLKQKSPHEKAIQKDLARTFPTHAYFQQGGGVGQENLFNVVKAYSLYDPEVGYTQGLAFIVAALLLNMPDEEAFCVLVRLMESYDLRSHFLPEMPGLQLRLYQFDRLLEELLPVLHLHFVRSRIKSSMYASQWFMTMFTYRFPLPLVYRIFDIVFAEGIEAIFRFSLALMAKNEQVLLEQNFEETLNFLQGGLFDSYKVPPDPRNPAADGVGEYDANRFVKDAYAMDITPFMLDNFTSEWQEKCRILLLHATEMDNLRTSNRNLNNQVHQLETAMTNMNAEHVDLVKQLVDSRVEKEEIEGELVKYKMLYAELFHTQQDAMSNHRQSNPSR